MIKAPLEILPDSPICSILSVGHMPAPTLKTCVSREVNARESDESKLFENSSNKKIRVLDNIIKNE